MTRIALFEFDINILAELGKVDEQITKLGWAKFWHWVEVKTGTPAHMIPLGEGDDLFDRVVYVGNNKLSFEIWDDPKFDGDVSELGSDAILTYKGKVFAIKTRPNRHGDPYEPDYYIEHYDMEE